MISKIRRKWRLSFLVANPLVAEGFDHLTISHVNDGRVVGCPRDGPLNDGPKLKVDNMIDDVIWNVTPVDQWIIFQIGSKG